MKRIYIYLVAIIAICSCSDSHVGFTKEKREGIKKDWHACSVLDEGVGEAMIQYANECSDEKKCFETENIKYEYSDILAVKKLLDRAGIKVKKTSFVEARYREEDVKNYACRVCKGNEKDSVCMVAGYKTMLLKLDTEKEEIYLDVVTICPPPRGCLKSPDTSSSFIQLPKNKNNF